MSKLTNKQTNTASLILEDNPDEVNGAVTSNMYYGMTGTLAEEVAWHEITWNDEEMED